MQRIFSLFTLLAIVILSTHASVAHALEGIGPRATVTGTVMDIQISKQNAFDEYGGTIVVKAKNGQIVRIDLLKETEIISEGRLSRKLLIPANLSIGMDVRVRGMRSGSDALKASLVVILNIEVNPILSASGIISSFDDSTITVSSPDGKTRTYTLTNETEVNISYTVTGAKGMQLVGKLVYLTLSPFDSSLVRIIRINGEPQASTVKKPLSIR